jgi:hypothetical protein
MIVVRQIKNITQLKKGDRWSINFTDGSNIVVKNPTFPFKIVGIQGMLVQSLQCDGLKKALFGYPKSEKSIALQDCYEWSREFDFDQIHSSWQDYFRFNLTGEVIDKRRPGKPIILKINDQGDIIISP